MSPDEIVSSYPTITLSDVHAALTYYYENRERIDTDVEEGRRFVAEMRASSEPSRLQKLHNARKPNGSDNSSVLLIPARILPEHHNDEH